MAREETAKTDRSDGVWGLDCSIKELGAGVEGTGTFGRF